MPRIHRYHVYYGLSTAQPPVETWSYTGKDFYDGYDTNQKFVNGQEPLCGTLVDMRVTYSYVPVAHLTRHVFIDRLQKQIDALRLPTNFTREEPNLMAKKNLSKETSYLKIGLLCLALAIFVGWRLLSGVSLPKASANTATPSAASVPAPAPSSNPAATPASNPATTSAPPSAAYKAIQTNAVIEHLLKTYRPRLSTTGYAPQTGFVGNVDFYDDFRLVETYQVKELHALGVSLIRKPYGADLIFDGKTFIVSPWLLPSVPGRSNSVAVTD